MALGAVVFAVFALKAPQVITLPGDIRTVNVPSGAQTITVPAPVVNVNVPKQTVQVVPVENQLAGALSGPDIYSPYLNVNGVVRWITRKASVSASTTPCAIKSPAATSTLVLGSFRIASTSASATYVEIGRATTAYATTTSLGGAVVAAGAQGTLTSLRTAAGGFNLSETFPPNTWFVVKVGGAAPTQIGGVCQATFEVI